MTWLEIKIFAREPLGVLGTLAVPVALFLLFARLGRGRPASADLPSVMRADVPVLAATFVALSAVLSLVAIIAIYRESGILKRLRATPLRPHTILTAQILAKLVFSALTLAALWAVGQRLLPVDVPRPWVSFIVAVLLSVACISTLGFVIAGVVPTARFAQPVGALVLYPMVGLSGLFIPVDALPRGLQAAAQWLPLTYAVSLQRGIWNGDGWLAHGGDVAALVVWSAVCLVLSNRVFRWE